MELTEDQKHQVRLEIARGLRDVGERLVKGEILAPRAEFIVDLAVPKDQTSLQAFVHGEMEVFSAFVSVDLPPEVI